MSIAHKRAVSQLGLMLGGYVQRQHVGEMMFSPYDVVLDPFTLMQPDVLVIAPVGLDVVRGHAPPPPPYLAVEVLSPSTARADRLCKRPRYQRAAIERWLVDLDSQLIERWTPDVDRPEICAERLVWQPAGARESLILDIPALMVAILGSNEVGAASTTVWP